MLNLESRKIVTFAKPANSTCLHTFWVSTCVCMQYVMCVYNIYIYGTPALPQYMTPQNYLKYAEFTVNTTEKCNIYRINRLCVLLRQGVGATAVCVSGVSGVSNYMDALGQGAGVVCCPCKCGCLWNCVDALDTGWSQVLSLQVLFRAFWTSCL